MKKYLVLITLLLLPITANAANANVDITASQKNVNVGNTVVVTVNVNSSTPIGYYEYTLNYDHDKLSLINGKSYNIEYANTNNQKSFKKKFTFKVQKNGGNKISIKSYAVTAAETNESMSVTVNPASINSSGEDTVNSSDNNYLSSLEIEDYTIEPKFNKNTTNYVSKIEDSIKEINIIAKAENKKASIIGNGKHDLKKGDNRIEVIVTSESGKDRIYTIKIRLSEKKPIEIKIDGMTYTVVKKLDGFSNTKNFTIKNIKIEDTTVESLYNSKIDVTLVALKDENGKTKLYIYNSINGVYTPYNELSSGDISILPIISEKTLKNHNLYTEIINNIEVECNKTYKTSDYCAIYAIDTSTGEKDWYVYNLKDKTIEKYKEEEQETERKKDDSSTILIYILSGTTLLFGIMTIIFAIKSGKRR